MVNASGDQFFLPDSSQFYFDDLSGEKYLRYVPNASHSLEKTDALENLAGVLCDRRQEHAAAADHLDVRDGWIDQGRRKGPAGRRAGLAGDESGGAQFPPRCRSVRRTRARALTPSGPNTWVARVPAPPKGLDGVLRRDVVPDRRQVSAQGDIWRARVAGHAAVSAAKAHRTQVVSGFSRTSTAKCRQQRPRCGA